MIEIKDKTKCSGCTACMNICPVHAIEMVEDEEGFKYPVINSKKCIKCNLCSKICPILNKQKMKDSFQQKTYLFQNKDEKVRMNSTAGGFFERIGSYVIEKKGIVYGACFDNHFKVIHKGTNNYDDLLSFCKSKYVQSDLGSIFSEIKKNLDNHILVCFSGTPCQVAGLHAYLKKDYSNLILIDIVCHSVPSPLVFEKYKEHILTKTNSSKIENIIFRDKEKYGYEYSMMTLITDKKKYSEGLDTDPYLKAFFRDISIRPSCSNCAFKTQKRVSDITIWDCFNIGNLDHSLDDNKGTTRILVHSEKGNNLVHELDHCTLKEISLSKAISNVKEMTHSVKLNSKRSEFFYDLNQKDIDVFDKYFPISFKTRISSFSRKLLCKLGLYNFIKYSIRKIKK